MNPRRYTTLFAALVAGTTALCFQSSSALATPTSTAASRPTLNAYVDHVHPWMTAPSTSPLAGVFSMRLLERTSLAPKIMLRSTYAAVRPLIPVAPKRKASKRTPEMNLGDMPFYTANASLAFQTMPITTLDARTADIAGQLFYSGPEAPGEAASLKLTRGLPTGHIAVNATGAAMSCMHHTRIPLYGGGSAQAESAADIIACGAAIGATSLTAVARVVADKNYASDVSTSLGIGVLAGWLVPKALHYGEDGDKRAGGRSRVKLPNLKFMVLPSMSLTKVGTIETVGATARGVF